jgi:hypothetical protein
MPIRPFLGGHGFDAETIRIMGIAFEMARFELRTVTISPMSISSPTGSSVLPRRASVTLTPSVEAHWPKTRHHAPLALAIARRKPRFADLKLADRIPAIEHIVTRRVP